MKGGYVYRFVIANDMKGQAEDAALELGLSSAAEYFRICLDHLILQRRLPAEFVGVRRIAKRGRPVLLPPSQQEGKG